MGYRVTLDFETWEARAFLMGQLSDGFGENHIDMKWRGDFDRARVFHVRPGGELWEHHQRIRALYPETKKPRRAAPKRSPR